MEPIPFSLVAHVTIVPSGISFSLEGAFGIQQVTHPNPLLAEWEITVSPEMVGSLPVAFSTPIATLVSSPIVPGVAKITLPTPPAGGVFSVFRVAIVGNGIDMITPLPYVTVAGQCSVTVSVLRTGPTA